MNSAEWSRFASQCCVFQICFHHFRMRHIKNFNRERRTHRYLEDGIDAKKSVFSASVGCVRVIKCLVFLITWAIKEAN